VTGRREQEGFWEERNNGRRERREKKRGGQTIICFHCARPNLYTVGKKREGETKKEANGGRGREGEKKEERILPIFTCCSRKGKRERKEGEDREIKSVPRNALPLNQVSPKAKGGGIKGGGKK